MVLYWALKIQKKNWKKCILTSGYNTLRADIGVGVEVGFCWVLKIIVTPRNEFSWYYWVGALENVFLWKNIFSLSRSALIFLKSLKYALSISKKSQNFNEHFFLLTTRLFFFEKKINIVKSSKLDISCFTKIAV